MSEEFGKDHGLVHEAVVTGRKVGAGQKFWETLAHNEAMFLELVSVIDGFSEIKPIENIIDLEADPFIPEGWSVLPENRQLSSRARGKWRFDPKKFKLYLAKAQKRSLIGGKELQQELSKTKQAVFGAPLLDWLLRPENHKFIPEEWKGKLVFFWGTIYRDRDGHLCVRYLYWASVGWHWSGHWLEDGWDARDPALVLASA